MVGKRKSLCAVLVLAGMLWAGLAAAANPIMLQSERWEPTVRQSINEMFVLYGKGSPVGMVASRARVAATNPGLTYPARLRALPNRSITSVDVSA